MIGDVGGSGAERLVSAAAAALTGSAALAANPIPTPKCQPGTVADAPERCSLPSYHWVKTIYYFGDHADAREAYVLLPEINPRCPLAGGRPMATPAGIKALFAESE